MVKVHVPHFGQPTYMSVNLERHAAQERVRSERALLDFQTARDRLKKSNTDGATLDMSGTNTCQRLEDVKSFQQAYEDLKKLQQQEDTLTAELKRKQEAMTQYLLEENDVLQRQIRAAYATNDSAESPNEPGEFGTVWSRLDNLLAGVHGIIRGEKEGTLRPDSRQMLHLREGGDLTKKRATIAQEEEEFNLETAPQVLHELAALHQGGGVMSEEGEGAREVPGYDLRAGMSVMVSGLTHNEEYNGLTGKLDRLGHCSMWIVSVPNTIAVSAIHAKTAQSNTGKDSAEVSAQTQHKLNLHPRNLVPLDCSTALSCLLPCELFLMTSFYQASSRAAATSVRYALHTGMVLEGSRRESRVLRCSLVHMIGRCCVCNTSPKSYHLHHCGHVVLCGGRHWAVALLDS